MPGAKQAWPNSAACWSPAMPLIGDAGPTPGTAPVSAEPAARRSHLGQHGRRARRRGRTARRTTSIGAMSNSIVRLALDGSVACTARPPVRFQSSQASIVPIARSGSSVDAALARAATPASSPRSRGRARGRSSAARAAGARRPRSSSQRAAVRRSCHTMARCSGRPVRRSQATTVSRWLVMPMAATGSSQAAPRPRAASPATASQISSASCSTQPGRGKCWVNSR